MSSQRFIALIAKPVKIAKTVKTARTVEIPQAVKRREDIINQFHRTSSWKALVKISKIIVKNTVPLQKYQQHNDQNRTVYKINRMKILCSKFKIHKW